MSCNICAEKYNKTSRKSVKCVCDFECCRFCIKTYLLSKNEDAHCMSCKVVWNRTFMAENFEKTFMTNDYRDYRENVLFERELGMLQATQPYVERNIEIEKLNKERADLEIEFQKYQSEYQKKINQISEKIYLTKENNVEKKKFVRKCPNGDCHGFLSTVLKCELCNHWACGDCREIKGTTTEEKNQHVCNKEILESVKLIEKDSKNCPNCSALIFKINGCNYMWCVECHISFDWKTLRIEKSGNHNPEYFEYLKRNGALVPRAQGDVLCGREIDNNFIDRIMQMYPSILSDGWVERRNRWGNNYYNTITGHTSYTHPSPHPIIEFSRNAMHIRYVELPRFRVDDRLNNNLELRISYMRNTIPKDYFKREIQKKEKENQKKQELANIIDMYINCCTDILYRLDKYNYEDISEEISNLIDYSNNCFKRVSNSYNCKCYHIYKKNGQFN